MPKAIKEKQKSNLIPILFFVVIVVSLGVFYLNEPPQSEKYSIRASGGEDGYRASFINVTGQNAEDKKIELSDDYWSGGKFK